MMYHLWKFNDRENTLVLLKTYSTEKEGEQPAAWDTYIAARKWGERKIGKGKFEVKQCRTLIGGKCEMKHSGKPAEPVDPKQADFLGMAGDGNQKPEIETMEELQAYIERKSGG